MPALRDPSGKVRFPPREFRAERRQIHTRMDQLLEEPKLSDDSVRFAQHLFNNREALFFGVRRTSLRVTT